MGFAAATVSAEGPAKPVIEGEMPDCYMPIGSDGITLFTNVSVPDGGTLKYMDDKVAHYEAILAGLAPDDTNPKNWTTENRPSHEANEVIINARSNQK